MQNQLPQNSPVMGRGWETKGLSIHPHRTGWSEPVDWPEWCFVFHVMFYHGILRCISIKMEILV